MYSATVAREHAHAHGSCDVIRREDESAQPVAQLEAEHVDLHMRGANPYRLRRGLAARTVQILEGDLLEGEVAGERERCGRHVVAGG